MYAVNKVAQWVYLYLLFIIMQIAFSIYLFIQFSLDVTYWKSNFKIKKNEINAKFIFASLLSIPNMFIFCLIVLVLLHEKQGVRVHAYLW